MSYDTMTDEEHDAIMARLVAAMTTPSLLAIPAVYDALSEELANEIIKVYEIEHPEPEYDDDDDRVPMQDDFIENNAVQGDTVNTDFGDPVEGIKGRWHVFGRDGDEYTVAWDEDQWAWIVEDESPENNWGLHIDSPVVPAGYRPNHRAARYECAYGCGVAGCIGCYEPVGA